MVGHFVESVGKGCELAGSVGADPGLSASGSEFSCGGRQGGDRAGDSDRHIEGDPDGDGRGHDAAGQGGSGEGVTYVSFGFHGLGGEAQHHRTNVPTAVVNQGCCPGPFILDGPPTTEPGKSTTVMFELSMHPGMDGPHDMTVNIPVTFANGTADVLAGTVTGDFHD